MPALPPKKVVKIADCSFDFDEQARRKASSDEDYGAVLTALTSPVLELSALALHEVE